MYNSRHYILSTQSATGADETNLINTADTLDGYFNECMQCEVVPAKDHTCHLYRWRQGRRCSDFMHENSQFRKTV